MSVAVIFAVQVAAHVTVGERDLPTVMDVIGDQIGPDYLSGQVIMLASGQSAAYIGDDDLEFTVQQLLEAVPELAAGRRFEVGFSEAPGSVTFAPDEVMITVTADYFQPFTAPTAELLPALLECCERFMAFARTAFAGNHDVEQRIAQLDPWVASARTALTDNSR
jgi:hypothetical protein